MGCESPLVSSPTLPVRLVFPESPGSPACSCNLEVGIIKGTNPFNLWSLYCFDRLWPPESETRGAGKLAKPHLAQIAPKPSFTSVAVTGLPLWNVSPCAITNPQDSVIIGMGPALGNRSTDSSEPISFHQSFVQV